MVRVPLLLCMGSFSKFWSRAVPTSGAPTMEGSEQRALPIIFSYRHGLARRGFLDRNRVFGREFLLRDRKYQLSIVIGDAIDPCRDSVPDEFAFTVGRQQLHGGFRVPGAAVEPALEVCRLDGHRHTMVQHRK